MTTEDYNKYYIQGSDHYLIPRDELKILLRENQELKKQVEEYQKDIKDLDNQNKRAFENMQLNQLKVCNMIKQQKEFINYLEDEKDRLIKETSHYYIDSFDSQHSVNETIYDEVDMILQKYKSIIGENKDEK